MEEVQRKAKPVDVAPPLQCYTQKDTHIKQARNKDKCSHQVSTIHNATQK